MSVWRDSVEVGENLTLPYAVTLFAPSGGVQTFLRLVTPVDVKSDVTTLTSVSEIYCVAETVIGAHAVKKTNNNLDAELAQFTRTFAGGWRNVQH